MKRFINALAPTLAIGALLISAGPGFAEDTFRLALDPATPTGTLVAGQKVVFDFFYTPDATHTGVKEVKGLQFELAADANFFGKIGFLPSGDSSIDSFIPSFKTAVPNTPGGGLPKLNQIVMGGIVSQAPNTDPLGTETQIGTISLTVKVGTNAGDTTIYLMDPTNFPAATFPGVTSKYFPALLNQDNTASPLTITTPGFKQTVQVVPGPSSLLVFAMGGIAPALSLIRRRRIARA